MMEVASLPRTTRALLQIRTMALSAFGYRKLVELFDADQAVGGLHEHINFLEMKRRRQVREGERPQPSSMATSLAAPLLRGPGSPSQRVVGGALTLRDVAISIYREEAARPGGDSYWGELTGLDVAEAGYGDGPFGIAAESVELEVRGSFEAAEDAIEAAEEMLRGQ